MNLTPFSPLRMIFGTLFIMAACASNTAGDASALLKKALADISNSRVPVYLPTVFPESFAKYGIKRVVARHTNSSYSVTFYYSANPSDASFAGMLAGSTQTLTSVPGAIKTKLRNELVALFSPVSCGGSCAPANLQWEKSGFQYSLQLMFPSNVPVVQQEQIIIKMADSMTLMESRKVPLKGINESCSI